MPPKSNRMTKNRPQPTRYRPGKAEAEDQLSEEESESGEDGQNNDVRQIAEKQPPPKAASFPGSKKLAVDLSKAGQQVSSAAKIPQKALENLEGFVTASESSGSETDESDEDTETEDSDSEEEEESSDDEPKKPMLRPTFMSKSKRAQQASTSSVSEDQKAAQDEKMRKEKADALLQAHIERDAAARAAGKKYWDDDDIAPEDEVDDTDGLDVEAELAAWKLRELKRVRRDRFAIEEKEKEREEIERRRNMTVEEREAEDAAYVAAQKDDKEGRGKMGYMQKYFHRGAFFNEDFQDEEVKNVLNRDLAGARFTDDTGDKSVLPEYMRMRDMTRLGKKGRTRYKDLKNEDTGNWGQYGTKSRESDNLDERFKPEDGGRRNEERTGANNAPIGDRKRREGDDRFEPDHKKARYE